MKSNKMNSLQRLFAFLMIAVLLVCTVAFVAGGLQSTPDNDINSGDVGDETEKTDDNTDNTDNTLNDTNQDLEDNESNNPPNTQPDEPSVNTPKFYNTMTGLETSEGALSTTPLGFVVDPKMPIYGISSADITFEFPLEKGKTRLLSYITNSSMLWKVGSITQTRAFISSTANLIGGIVVSYGNDDIVKYSAWDASKANLDISKISGCYYVENTLYIYTSKDMVDTAQNASASVVGSTYKSAPYLFSDTDVTGTTKASSVILPYSDADKTSLYYSNESQKYLYFKSDARKVDMLNGKNISFTNVFILFANSTTYDNSVGTELVVDNTSGGSGYYISKGYLTEIKWSVSDSGALEFRTLGGEILSVNRGNAYIGYYKASCASEINIG